MTDAKLIAQLRSVHAAAYYCDLAVGRIEALRQIVDETHVLVPALRGKISDTEAKLAKAVEALRKIAAAADAEWVTINGKAPPDVQSLCDIASAIVAEIKGGSHAPL